MSEYSRPRAVPAGPQGQQPQQEPPDFLAYAHDQLRRAHRGVSEMASSGPGEGDEKVIALRIRIAECYTALADIQYGLPGDDDEALGWADEAEPGSRR